jgi:hypothetical protein
MFTETGQEITVSKEIFPELVDLVIESRPRSSQITVNQANQFSPHAYRAIVGTEQEIKAWPTTIYEHDIWVFSHWLTGGVTTSQEPELNFLAPDQKSTYTAAYIYDRPAHRMWLSGILN